VTLIAIVIATMSVAILCNPQYAGVPMNILVYGAGVIGSLYAARLHEAGHQVTVLARGSRLADIRQYGLVLEDIVCGARTTTRVAITGRLAPEDSYDVALIAVRRDQLSGIMPDLTANKNIPAMLFMLNNPLGSAWLINALGADRVLLGFPGAGGTIEDHVVSYAMIAQQPTTLGEPGGRHTARLRAFAEALRTSGFRTRIDRDMDAWLASHAFFVTAVSGAIYLAGGDCERLSRNQPLLKLMVSGVREGFCAVRALGRPIHPFALKVLFTWLPRPCAVFYWRRFFSHRMADYVFARHACYASAEMRTLAAECRLLLDKSGVVAPALNQLYRAIVEYAVAHQEQVRPSRSS
jgi:2-dehydropantoate 2-reductase